jgi:CO/xanthine dehydrogenase Mo-binding subunit
MALNVVGKSVERNDAFEKVTGRASYVADIKLPGMLHAKVLRSEHAHAKIVSIDVSLAEKMPGVGSVVTGRDCTTYFGACYKDQHPIAVEKVRHAGEAVAIVIADSERLAEKAAAAIKVTYDPLPFVIDPMLAIKEGAPLVHEDNGRLFHLGGFFPVPGTNIFHHYKLRSGSSASAFGECEHVVEGEFTYPLLSHAPMEPHGCIVCWDSPNSIRVWSSTQGPFVIRELLGEMFHIPLCNIKVFVSYLGGAFGGKSDSTVEPLCAYAARTVPGRPVRLILSRKEVFTSTYLGRGMKGTIKLGAKKDGTLHALEASLYFADGAYADGACNVVQAAGYVATGPYEIKNCSVDAYGIYTNSPPVGAFRGYGHPEAHLMIERMMDILARKFHVKPGEFRNKNFLGEGKENALGQKITRGNGDLPKCLELTEAALFNTPKPENDDEHLYGRGIAAFMKTPMMPTNACSGATLFFGQDGSANINMSGVEMGQGAQTVLQQMAAETLKIPMEKVRISKTIDTDLSPHEWQTVASITTFRVGNAIIKACNDAIGKILKNASMVLHRPVDDLVYEGTYIASKCDQNVRLDVKPLLLSYVEKDGHAVGEPVIGTGTHICWGVTSADGATGRGNVCAQWTFGCQGVEIRIHRKTGKVTVTHLVIAIDLGRLINPELARGQMVGGMMMGLGAALQEEILFDDRGKIKNATLNNYSIPTLADMPEKLTVLFVETPQEDGPFGARCIAEHPVISVPPAILNALHDATGREFFEIPVKPQALLAALEGRN